MAESINAETGDNEFTDEPQLSAEELHCLLHDDGEQSASHPTSQAPTSAQIADTSNRPIEPTDNEALSEQTDASILSPAALIAIENLTRNFAERFQSGLTARLHVPVSVEVVQFDQPTFAEFVGQMEQPTCFQTITASAFDQPFHWEWSSRVLFPLLDRLLGGGQLPPTIARRALTEIERRLATNITNEMLAIFTECWHPTAPLAPELQRIDASPRSMATVEAATQMWAAELKITIGENQGPFRIAYQQSTLASLADALITADRKPHTPAVVSVVLAESLVDEGDLSGLRVGDILTMDAQSNDEATIYIDDEPTHRGVPGAKDGRKAVRLV